MGKQTKRKPKKKAHEKEGDGGGRAAPRDTATPASARRAGSGALQQARATLRLKPGEAVDVCDARDHGRGGHGRWFEGRIISVRHEEEMDQFDIPTTHTFVTVHYFTWPSEFDEEVPFDRIAPRGVCTPQWREALKEGSFVEIFNPCVQRWVTGRAVAKCERRGVKVALGRPSRKAVPPFGDEWMAVDSEQLARRGMHLSHRVVDDDDDAPEAMHPGGTPRALAVAEAALLRDDRMLWVRILRELMDQGIHLSQDTYTRLFSMVDSGLIVDSAGIEARRYKEALCALILERQVDAGGNESSIRHNFYISLDTAVNRNATDDETLSAAGDGSMVSSVSHCLGMTRKRVVQRLLRHKATFQQCVARDVWTSTLSPTVRQMLQTADALEDTAAVASLSLAYRRLMYAEACRMMELAAEQVPAIEAVVHVRLARTYVNGLGVDITEPALQDAADVQAVQYLDTSTTRSNPRAMFLYGLLISLGRCRVMLGPGAWDFGMTMITHAAETGYEPAMYYRARLLIEGVVPLPIPRPLAGKQHKQHRHMSPRRTALVAACELLGRCYEPGRSTYTFVWDAAEEDAERVKALLDLAPSAWPGLEEVHYELALHVFARKLEQLARTAFPAAVYRIIQDEAQRRSIPFCTCEHEGATSATPTADWCKNIAQRMFSITRREGDTMSESKTSAVSKSSASSSDPNHDRSEFYLLRQLLNVHVSPRVDHPTPSGIEEQSSPSSSSSPTPSAATAVTTAAEASASAEPVAAPSGAVSSTDALHQALSPASSSITHTSEVSTSRDGSTSSEATSTSSPPPSSSQPSTPSSSPSPSPSPPRAPAVHWSNEAVISVLSRIRITMGHVSEMCKPLDGLQNPALQALTKDSEVWSSVTRAPVEQPSCVSTVAATQTAGVSPQQMSSLSPTQQSPSSTPSPPTDHGDATSSQQPTSDDRFITSVSLVDLWESCLAHAALVASKTSHGHERFLRERVACLADVERVKAIDRGVDEVEAVEVAVLSRRLARDAREAFPQMEKHVLSARAVRAYAAQYAINVEQSIQCLDLLAGKLLAGLPASDGYISRIGYHAVVEAQKVEQFSRAAQTRAPDRIKGRVEFLRAQAELNRNWRGPDSGDPSLLAIFFQFQAMVDNVQDHMSSNEVYLNLRAVTFSDPWALFATGDVDETVQDITQQAEALCKETGLSSMECLEMSLVAEVYARFVKLRRAFPPFPADAILDRLGGYHQEGARVLLKKKMVHLLRTAPDVDWDTQDGLDVLAQQLTAALDGRCPDGISSFCDQFQQGIVYRKMLSDDALRGDMPSPEVSKLITSVALMVYHVKQLFIKRHLSRDPAQYEHRTVAYTTLNTMLLLPLSLPGEFGYIRYPRYAEEGIYQPKGMTYSPLAALAVCQRLLHGGEVVFEYDGGVRDPVSFPELSLKRIAHTLRSIIVHSEAGGEGENPREDPATDGLRLYPRPRLDYHIDEKVIEEFVKRDLVLGKYYEEAFKTEWTHANLFFKALDEDADDKSDDNDGDSNVVAVEGEPITPVRADTRPVISRVMKDAALIRILQVCNYCTVAPQFYETLTPAWTIPPQQTPPPSLPQHPSLSMPPPSFCPTRACAAAAPPHGGQKRAEAEALNKWPFTVPHQPDQTCTTAGVQLETVGLHWEWPY